MEKSLWSTEGRITIGAYWLRFLIAVLVWFFGVFVIVLIFGPSGTGTGFDVQPNPVTDTISSIWQILIAIFIIIQGFKRTQDVGKSGWYFLIPIYQLILSLTPGTIGPNRYGLDPKEAKKINSKQSNRPRHY